MQDEKLSEASGGTRKAAQLVKTSTPGIYKRGGRYVLVWTHRGRQHKSFHRTLAEAREAKGQRQTGSRRPSARQPFADYARAWLDGLPGSYRARPR